MKISCLLNDTCACLLLCSSALLGWASANASIIDTRPNDGTLAYSFPDTAGGSFTADDSNLASFTLDLADPDGGGIFRAVVMNFSGAGLPSTVLWESTDLSSSAAVTEFTFMPNLALTIGDEYFIGIDSGLRTTAAGSHFLLGYRVGDVLSGGQMYQDLNGAGFTASGPLFDIASRIEMNSVPLPAAVWLFSSSLIGLIGIAKHKKV